MISLWPNYLFPNIVNGPEVYGRFDLIIAAKSLTHVTELQMQTYVTGLAKVINHGGVLFEQSHEGHTQGFVSCKQLLSYTFMKHRRLEGHFPIMQGAPDLWCHS